MLDLLDEHHVATTKALITQWEADAASTRNEIERLEREIDGHRSTLSRLDGLIAEQKAQIAPVRRLPFEILGEIICYCTLDHDATPNAVRTMAAVSRTWRRTTLSTPRAWSKIPLNCRPEQRSDWLSLSDARLWFTRAGACGKLVSITGNGEGAGSELLCNLLDLIQQHCATLASLDLCFFFLNPGPAIPDEVKTKLSALLSKPMPVLQHLVMRRYCAEDHVKHVLDVANKPRLTALYVDGCDAPWFAALRHTRLRHLSLQYLPSAATLDELHRTAVLNGLRSLLILAAEKDSHDAGALKANNLEVLGLNNVAGPQNFVAWLSAPRLTKLILRGDQRHKRSEATQCFQALVSSQVPLKELYLMKFVCSDTAILALLVGLPLLETFVAEAAQLSDAVLHALSTPNYIHGKKDVGWVCPRLARLSIHCVQHKNAKEFSREAMEALVDSRLKAFRREAIPAGGSADADPVVQPIAELVAVRYNRLNLVGFAPDIPRDRWEWVPHSSSGHVTGEYEWWATSAGEVHF